MDGTTLFMHKGVVDVSGHDSDSTRINLRCGGHIRVEESPIDGLRILPSGNVQIGDVTIDLRG